ncbi:MAG: T9SS type A sorting domain-containing protein [Bacteroidales bacterium]|nr:T9SS type A sorting domain-containing protein [Bacteroidales bacterium]MCF8392041.1 T9SS type A sorting domain-containing protein [Bacteroidales bacterium]
MRYSVQAESNDPNATIVITQVANINGTEAERTATVLVTSADQSVTATTTIVFTLGDYWYKEGFDEIQDLEGWRRNGVMQDQTPNFGSTDLYPGVGALKFTRGHPGDTNPDASQDAGYLLSPKLINVGTLTFWAWLEKENFTGEELNIYIKTSETDSTLVKSMSGSDLRLLNPEWVKVEVVIEEATDSIQIKIEGICDIDNDGTSRIWMDDFLVTYWEAPIIGADDATLASLSVGGMLIDGFDPAVTSYTMEASILIDPTVTAEATDVNATVVITQAIDVFGTLAEKTATIVVTSADGTVTSTTTIVFNPPTSISDFNSSEVSIYPNPVNGLLNLRMPANSYQGIEIFNMLGQKVMQETIKVGQKSINVEGLNKGVYVMSLSGEAGTHTAKFIKE